jgi:hypothetical protein
MTTAAVRLGLARIWLERGRKGHAIAQLQLLLQEPEPPREAFVVLGNALRAEQRWSEAEAVYRRGLEQDPSLPELHKGWIDCLEVLEGLDAAFDRYDLVRVSGGAFDHGAGAVSACSVFRNEGPRLPAFLAHYRRLGVSAFFMVDNGSSDGGPAYLADQPDVVVWRSGLPFHQANFGSAWFELLLRRYGRKRWWVMADADEHLVYPGSEHLALPELCHRLEAAGRRALPGMLLDMYGPGPVADTLCPPGVDPLQACPHFDRVAFHRCQPEGGPYRNLPIWEGGARERVFGAKGGWILTKVPLLHYDLDCLLAGGQHLTNLPPTALAEARAAVLHFKYLASFPTYVAGEVERGEHYGGGFQYREYARQLAEGPLTLFDPDASLTYEGTAQLQQLGLLVAGELDTAEPDPGPPPVAPLPASAVPRPFWSVLITVHDRTEHLEEALASVLLQDPGPGAMEILVVADWGGMEDSPGAVASSVRRKVEAIVEALGRGRVRLVVLPAKAGHPHVFNQAVALARGQWLHLLHDDDRVEPGFYATLKAGLTQEPEVGLAFCRHRHLSAAGAELRLSPLEREQAGLLGDWPARIAVHCRLQTPATVVRRSAYETVGGYDPGAHSAFDWDLWQRLAGRFATWYEPQVLAGFREHPGSVSSGLRRSGRQIEDALIVLERGVSALPESQRSAQRAAGRRRLAAHALDLAARFRTKGDSDAVLANLRAAVRCSRSETVLQSLADQLAAAPEGPA